MLKSNVTQIIYAPRPDATSEAELDVLCAVYRYVLFDSQTSKGGTHDVTGNSSKECARPDQKGKENADLHGN